jgi:hypothetical protein
LNEDLRKLENARGELPALKHGSWWEVKNGAGTSYIEKSIER